MDFRQNNASIKIGFLQMQDFSLRLSSFQHIVSIPSVRDYRDRIEMFCKVGESFANQIIYLRSGQIDEVSKYRIQYPNTQFSLCADQRNQYTKVLSLWRFLSRIDSIPAIVQDLFSPDLTLLHKMVNLQKTVPAYYFYSIYFPNSKYLREKGWVGEIDEYSKSDLRAHIRLFRKRSTLDATAAKVCDGITGNSLEIVQSMMNYHGFPVKRIKAIPTGICIENYPLKHNQKPEIGIPLESRFLLYVGSIQPRKAIGFLLSGLALLKNILSEEIKLVICGDYHVKDHAQYDLLIEKLDLKANIIFLGRLNFEKLAAAYLNCDCFVHPSQWEGSARVVKEALAFGSKVVAADIPGNRIIDPDAKFINYFRPADLESFCSAVVNCLSSKGNIQTQRNYLRSNFSPQIIAAQYISFYQEILQSRVTQQSKNEN